MLGCTALAFLVFYFILSYYNRLASDDIVFKALIKDKSVFEGLSKIYTIWSGRWASWGYLFTLLSSSSKFQNLHYFIFIYHCITLLILIYSVNTIIRIAINKLFNVIIDAVTQLIYTILFIAGFYYATFHHMEVWWWVSASVYYLQGIVFLLLGIALLLKEKKNIFHYVLIGASFLYVGASFELYACIVVCLFISIYFYLIYKKTLITFKKSHYFNALVIAFICFTVSAIACFIAPGNFERRALFENAIVNYPALNSSTFFQTKYIVFVAFSMVFVLLGKEIKNRNPTVVLNVKTVLLIAIFPLLISIGIGYLFQFFILYGNPIPLRGWTFTSLSLCFFISVFFMVIGHCVNFSKIIVQLFLKSCLPIFICTSQIYTACKQYNYVSKYSKAYDKQIEDLLAAKTNKANFFYSTPLPNSGMLIYLYMDGYTALPLKEILNLNFEILEKNK